MTTFPSSLRRLKGAIIGRDPGKPLSSAIVFPYIPDTMTLRVEARSTGAGDKVDRSEALRLTRLRKAITERPLFQPSVEGELVRVMSADGLKQEMTAGAAFQSVIAAATQISNDAFPTRLGQEFAHAVLGGIRQ